MSEKCQMPNDGGVCGEELVSGPQGSLWCHRCLMGILPEQMAVIAALREELERERDTVSNMDCDVAFWKAKADRAGALLTEIANALDDFDWFVKTFDHEDWVWRVNQAKGGAHEVANAEDAG